MTEDIRWDRMWSVFGAIAELDPISQSDYLEQELGDDPELRVAVEKLLEARSNTTDMLQTPTFSARSRPTVDPRSLIGVQIGDYVPTAVLGEGGMGVVYSAWQGAPLNRQVALKVIRAGMDSAEVLRRFDAERELLAAMTHPNIAQVFDAGSTAGGRAWFVMELICGLPISAYCQHHRLNLAQRLDLFGQVCAGLQHAHQKGVIHRDIKPGNVMASGEADCPQVKIIDFGIAKAVEGRAPGFDLRTAQDGPVGTPQYMSPEQAAPTAGVDTRSDIYSLGALLFRLLTGHHPLASGLPGPLSGGELRQLIENRPAQPASQRVTAAPDAEFLSGMDLSAQELATRLHGDLDWIILKAMAPERDQRYSAVSELAGDLQRYLRHEPVLAGPPSRAYRLRKFVRRHRVGVAAGSAIAASLIVGVIGTTFMAIEARQQQAQAQQARAQAEASASQASRILVFLRDMLVSGNPWTRELAASDAGPLTVRNLLDAASARLSQFSDDPSVRDELYSVLIRTYHGLGEYQRALDLYDQLVGTNPLTAVTDETQLDQQGHYLSVLIRAGRYGEAITLGQQLLDASEQLLGHRHKRTLQLQRGLGNALILKGDDELARVILEDNLARASKVSPSSKETFEPRQLLAVVHSRAGRWDEAVALQSAAMRDSIAINGKNHLSTLRLGASQGDTLFRQGKLDEAIALYSDVIERMVKHIGPDDGQVFRARSNLGVILNARGRFAQAIPLLEGVQAHRLETLGDQHPSTLNTQSTLANSYLALGRLDEALDLHQRVLQTRIKAQGADHPRTHNSRADVGRSQLALAQFEPALDSLNAAYAGLLQTRGAADQWTLSAGLSLGRALAQGGQFAPALEHLQTLAPDLATRFPADHWIHSQMQAVHGNALIGAGSTRQGAALLRQGYQGLVTRFGSADYRAVQAARALANWSLDPE